MIGAIAGDIIGSYYEFNGIKTKDFELFRPECKYTDDSIMVCAVAYAIMHDCDYRMAMHQTGRSYLFTPDSKNTDVGWGKNFYLWLVDSNPKPYNSYGNGSAMRVSPVGWAFDTEEEVLKQARLTALPSHNHPEGIKGAEAVALAIFMARNGASNADIKSRITSMFGYNLDRTIDSIRPDYKFQVSCQKSVPESIICFLEASSYEDAIRNAVSLGGDADTQAAIAGSIAEARWGVPEDVENQAMSRLDSRLTKVVLDFKTYINEKRR